MPRYAFEDFHVGQVIPCGSRTVTADEIVAFATQFDPQPFHVDDEAGRRSIYGSLIASGWHSVSVAMRMVCDGYLLDSTSMGSPGRRRGPLDEAGARRRHASRATSTVLETRPSRSKPDRGVVVTEWRVENQHDELVLTSRGMGMFRRRPA